VFGSRKWTRVALALNLAGTLLLFWSFQATSSSFRLLKRHVSPHFPTAVEYSICVEDYTLLSTNAHGEVFIGGNGCPTSEDDRPAAVVNTEHPLFITIGFCCILIGFITQFFAVPEPKTIAQLRHEIKMLKLQAKAEEEQNRE
jgi:hypothetical protein